MVYRIEHRYKSNGAMTEWKPTIVIVDKRDLNL